MSLAIETFTYAAMLVLALSLLYLFGPLQWYWHALSVVVALVLEVVRVSASIALPSSFFHLAYGNLIIFLLSWGMCGPFFRHHHMPPLHHY
jgi:hypothetical protein